MASRAPLTLAATGLVLLSACNNSNPPGQGPGLHTISIKEISATSGGPVSQVRGRFVYTRANAGEPSIASDGRGGACILQQQIPETACSGAQDPDKGASECSPPTNGWGYCLDKKTLSGVTSGQCWIKGPRDCMRAPRENNGQLLVEGQSYDVPNTTTIPVTRPAKVRMVACVNAPFAESLGSWWCSGR